MRKKVKFRFSDISSRRHRKMNGPIICIGRQYGSGGREIGEKLAKKFGIVCYDKLLIQKAAKEAGLAQSIVSEEDEKPFGLCELISGNPFADSISLSEAFYSQKETVFEAEAKTILELAKKGPCVIIGRCASSILREAGYPVLSVFIYADDDARAKRIAARNGIDEKAAAHEAKKRDRMRKAYFDFYADTPWGDARSYDLMISSSRFGIDSTVDLLAKTAREMSEKGTEK